MNQAVLQFPIFRLASCTLAWFHKQATLYSHMSLCIQREVNRVSMLLKCN